MTTLYRPVLIESAGQAEALPIGTLAKRPQHYSIEKVDERPDEWTDTCNAEPRTSSDVIGWTALVPIEAEEEWALIYDGEEPTPCADEADAREWARIDGEEQAPSRRYTTIWEETP